MKTVKSKEKGSVPGSIIVFITIIAVSIGSIYAYSEIMQDEPSENNTQPITGEYETYNNENYNFSLEYPTDWVLEENNIEENTATGKATIGAQAVISPTEIPQGATGQMPKAYILAAGGRFDSFNLENTRQQLNGIKMMLQSQFGESENAQFEIPEFKGPENIERNGVEGISFITIDPDGILQQMGLPPGYSHMIFLEGENFVYQMQIQAQMGTYENMKPDLEHVAESFTPEN